VEATPGHAMFLLKKRNNKQFEFDCSVIISNWLFAFQIILISLRQLPISAHHKSEIYTENSEDLFQPQNAKLAPEPPGAHCGPISATAGIELTPLRAETAHSGTQFGPLVPAQPL